MWVKKQQLELDMEQQTGPKLGKEYVKAVYCHPAYLTYMQSPSREMLGWNQDFPPPHGKLFSLYLFFYLTILYWFCHTLS